MLKISSLLLFIFSYSAFSCVELPWISRLEELNENMLNQVQFDEIKRVAGRAKHETIIAVIGDGINPEEFGNALAINSKEIPNNGKDDDANGIVDDYYGVNFSTGNGTNFGDVNYHEKFVSSLVTMFSGSRCESDYPVKVLSLKITKNDGRFDDLYMKKLADAIDYAIGRGAKIINMSLGVSKDYKSFFQFIDGDYNKSFKYLNDAIERARRANVVLLGASSNDNNRNQSVEPEYPADMKHVISVTSVNLNHEIKRAFGKIIMTAFYGEEIHGLKGDTVIIKSNGTSYATPMIAATIGLALSINPDSDLELIREFVAKASSHPISGGRQIRNGVFDPLEFLSLAL